MRTRPMTSCGYGFAQFVLLVSLCFGVASEQRVKAQVTAPLPVGEALRIRQFASLVPVSLSPDGKWLAYTVQQNSATRWVSLETYERTGIPPWSVGTHLELVNVETGQVIDLTNGTGNAWLPVWSPNGAYLAFLSNRGGDRAQLWVWNRANHEIRGISSVTICSNQIEWTPDSQRIAVTTVIGDRKARGSPQNKPPGTGGAKPPAGEEANASTVLLYKCGSRAGVRQRVLRSQPWDLAMYLRNLTLFDVDGAKFTTLVHGRRITTYSISPTGTAIAYTVPVRFEKPSSQQILFDLRVVTLSGREDRTIASGIRMDYDGAAFSWSPDGSGISFHTGGVDEKTFDCYVANLGNHTLENVTRLPASLMTNRQSKPLWDAKGHIYFIERGALWRADADQRKASEVARVPDRRIVDLIPWRNDRIWAPGEGTSTVVVTHDDSRKQDGFYRIDLRTGASERLLEQGQCYTCANVPQRFTVSQDGRNLVYFAEDARHEEDLWVSGVQFHAARRLTHLNPQFDRYKLGAVRLINWLSDDGDRLHGALLLPADYRKGLRYPLIVWVYGGIPLSNDLDHFGLAGPGPFNLQLFATRGYAVLLPDAPQHLGTPLFDLAKTVLPGVNKVIQMGIADPNRLGVAGHSYGGYSVLSLIVETQRFKAAAELDGFADLIADYGEMNKDGTSFGVQSDEEGQGLMGGTPWQVWDRYVENSPIFHLDRVETPLLIIQGGNDRTVRPFLADQIFVGLRRLGKQAEYVKYEGESHTPVEWSYADQVNLCHRLIAWFDAHLGKEKSH